MLFLFLAPSGTIVACTLHAPGSWHGIFISQNRNLYDKLDEIFNSTRGKCVIDAAFATVSCPYLMKSGEKCFRDCNLLVNWVKMQATSLHKTADWGVRALQGSYSRVKDRITFLDDIPDGQVF
jgi:hypothetical protein